MLKVLLKTKKVQSKAEQLQVLREKNLSKEAEKTYQPKQITFLSQNRRENWKIKIEENNNKEWRLPTKPALNRKRIMKEKTKFFGFRRKPVLSPPPSSTAISAWLKLLTSCWRIPALPSSPLPS